MLCVRLSEHMVAPRLQLFRRFQWSDLATCHALDTRQYRDQMRADFSTLPASNPRRADLDTSVLHHPDRRAEP
jgi:phosphodiesterase/alkaline phosphatase D-like protein